jgi:hypothetical protein
MKLTTLRKGCDENIIFSQLHPVKVGRVIGERFRHSEVSRNALDDLEAGPFGGHNLLHILIHLLVNVTKLEGILF